jgi:nitroimidazol reductase NimA-like FMN-containing flavoprotein (pyridoxamine 5'-phosphate oxidase superfamily)
MDTDSGTGVAILATDACWGLLRSTDVGRLAVSVAGEPDIFPVNYVVDQGTVVFRTAPGTKLSGVAIGQAVAFEVDGYDPDAGEAWSVVVRGRGEQITRSHELIDTTDLPLFPWQVGEKHRFVRIVPTNVSGRRFHVVDRSVWATPLTDARRTSLD